MPEFNIYNYDLKSLVLIDTNNNGVDIRNLVAEIDIFEDLFKNTLNASLVMNDSRNLIERFPIVGDEYIQVNLTTPTIDDEILLLFKVFKVSNRSYQKKTTQTYILHCISDVLDLNGILSDYSTYRGSASDNVQSIYKNYFSKSGIPLYAAPSSGSLRYTGVGESPLKLINYFAKEAQSATYPASTYVFYQDHTQFNFVTVDELIDREPVDNFYFESQVIDETENFIDKPKEYQKVLALSFENNIDTLSNAYNGFYYAETYGIDPIIKQFKTFDYQYNRDFEKTKRLGKNKIIRENSRYIADNSDYTDYFVTNFSENYNFDLIKRDPVLTSPRRIHIHNSLRRASLMQLESIKLKVTISGNSQIKCGDTINLFVPLNGFEEEYRKMYHFFFGGNDVGSAKFLVTKVNHHVSLKDDRYLTVMEVSKNGFAEPVLTESERLA